MIFTGTLVNVLLVVIGGAIGYFLKERLPARLTERFMQAMGLFVLVLGLTYVFASQDLIIVLISALVGALLGEWMDIDRRLTTIGDYLENKLKKDTSVKSTFSQGFVSASLLFCVGAMAIIGSMQSGMDNNHTTLITKSFLDLVAAAVLASTLGIGVIFSAVSVFIYQGSLTLISYYLGAFIPSAVMVEMNAVGGLLLIGLAFRMLDIKAIKIANLLPAIFIPIVLMIFM